MKDINLRIKSIKSTKQITKAMELVATSKLTKAKERIEKSRIFHKAVYTEMCDLAARNNDTVSEYVAVREVKKSCYVVIAGDRGLAGGYNNNMFNFAAEQIGDKAVCILPVGKKATEYYRRHNHELLTTEFSRIEEMNVGSCHDMSRLLTKAFKNNEFDELYIVYTKFNSVLSQQPSIMKVLPIDGLDSGNENVKQEFILFEPSSNSVFNAIVPSYIAGMLWGSICESTASEFGARRTAMESATKNAEEMIDDLSLKYNRARQGSITQEITEIVAGSGL